jgi:hypothetical protein
MDPYWDDETKQPKRFSAITAFLFGINVLVSLMFVFIMGFLMMNRDTLLEIMQFPTRTELEAIDKRYDEQRLKNIETQLDTFKDDLTLLEQASGDVSAENLRSSEQFQTAIGALRRRITAAETNLKTQTTANGDLQSWKQDTQPTVDELIAFKSGTCLWSQGGDTDSERAELANYACTSQ